MVQRGASTSHGEARSSNSHDDMELASSLRGETEEGSSDKATPPVTPPLSVASSHGISCSRTRKRPSRKALAGHNNGDNDSDDNDHPNCGSSPRLSSPHGHHRLRTSSSLSSTFPLSSSSCCDDDDNVDVRTIDGDKKRGRRNWADGRRNRCHRRLYCCPSGWCLLGVGLCLAVVHLTFKIVWYFWWQARCTEGCYDGSAMATGAQGPEQVHLAYSGVDADGNPTGITVVWTAAAGKAPPVVEYGLSRDDLNLKAHGSSIRYLDTVHHRASLEDLAPGTRFFYRCGNPSSSSTDPEANAGGGGDGLSEGGPTLEVSVGGHGDIGGEGEAGDLEPDVDSDGSLPTEAPTTKLAPGAKGVRGAGGGGSRGGGETVAVMDSWEWSSVYSFVTAPEPERWEGDGPWDRPVSVAVVGDLGLVNAGSTFDRLHQLVGDNEVDFVLHLGDIAYADDAFLERPWSFGYENKWDAFMRRASHEFATKVPYMVVPGNHEAECHSPACLSSSRMLNTLGNFTAYNARFRMPSIESGADHGTSMWYSFNVGPVHFVVVDTETDFPGAPGDHYPDWVGFGQGNGGFGDQIAWLEKDLATAQQERDVRPWIVVSGHRPIYSTEYSDGKGRVSSGQCNRIRKVFEPIFEKNKVDLYLSGHVHAFERSLPVFDNKAYFNRSDDSGVIGNEDAPGFFPATAAAAANSNRMVYEDPVAPVHIINGAGGCIEGFTMPDPVFPAAFPEWRAASVSMVRGVGILTFPSKAEMRSTFVTSDSPVEVLDELTIRHRRSPSA